MAQIALKRVQFAVIRGKNGANSTSPLRGPEIRAFRRLKRAYEGPSYAFITERKEPLTASGVRKILAWTGEKAGLEFSVHPHMLRHGCGFTRMIERLSCPPRVKRWLKRYMSSGRSKVASS